MIVSWGKRAGLTDQGLLAENACFTSWFTSTMRIGGCRSIFKGKFLPGVAAACLLWTLPAWAGDADQINRLVQKGALQEALSTAEAAIARKPQDANLRFLKGVVLAQLDRKQDAAAVFVAMTHDFPKLPEPYNNLGVIQASSGEYERARESLLHAIKLSPNYSVAHENLGDLYARLAMMAFEKAAQADTANAKAKSKLSLARSLTGVATSAASGAVAGPAAKVPSTQDAAIAAARQASAPNAAKIAAVSSRPGDAGMVAATSSADEKAVLDALGRWASAWSARDVKAYLASYASDFAPASGTSLEQWKGERRARIEDKREIRVEVQQAEVRFEAGRAKVKFKQNYRADKLQSQDLKLLTFSRQDNRWLIQSEQVIK